MQRKWKKAFLWSSLGGLTVGAVAAAVLGNRRTKKPPLLQLRAIPATCTRVVIWTERFETDWQDTQRTAHDTYVLEATQFKVWRVWELTSASGVDGADGLPVYHITYLRYLDPKAAGEDEEERLLDRFYATTGLRDLDGKLCGKNRVARGGILELAKCLVGGAANGIETDEIHYSMAPILNFRFESLQAAATSQVPESGETLETSVP